MGWHRRGAALLAAVGVFAAVAPAAEAAAKRGTVLSVNRASHVVKVVGANHQAASYRVKGKLGRRVKTGAKVTFRARGRAATRLKVVGTTRTISVRGRVSNAKQIRLADGSVFKVGNVTVTLVGFRPGQEVEVTVAITDAGDINVIVEVAHDGDCNGNCPLRVEGHVTALDDTDGARTITVDPGEEGGEPYVISVTAEQLALVKIGDEVEVCAHQGETGWVADRINVDGEDDDNHDGVEDRYGVVHEINTADGFFVLVHPGAASAQASDGEPGFRVYATADQLAAIHVDEVVHVVVHRDGDRWVADSVEEVPAPPAPTLNLLVKVLEINADDGWFRVGGVDSAPDDTAGLHVYDGDCDLAAAGIAVGDTARVHATRTAPEHWSCTAVEKIVPPGGGA